MIPIPAKPSAKPSVYHWTHPLFDHLYSLCEPKNRKWAMQEFIKRLFYHHLVPIYLRSHHPSLVDIDSSSLAEMQRFSQGNTQRILSMTNRFKTVLKALSEQGTRFAVYKGPVLSQRLFGDIAVRQYGDIDLLIHPDDLLMAFQRLIDAGFESTLPPSPFIKAYLKKSRRDITLGDPLLHLDLHQQIARGPRYYILPEENWHRLETITVYKQPYPILPLEAELIILSVHAARHGWDHYKLLLDFAGLLIRNPDPDWQKINQLVNHFQARTMFDLGVSLARSIFPDLAKAYTIKTNHSLMNAILCRQLTILDQEISYSDFSMLGQFFRLQNKPLNRIRLALFYLGYPRPEDPILNKFTHPGAIHLLPLIHPFNLLISRLLPKKGGEMNRTQSP